MLTSEGGTGSDAGLVLTRLHKPHLLFLPWSNREVEVHHHWRMVAACRYALLVKVLDVPHNPMAADSDRIEAPSGAWRVLPPPSPVGDGKGPGRLARPKPVHLIGMKGEPAAQRVIEIVHLARAEQIEAGVASAGHIAYIRVSGGKYMAEDPAVTIHPARPEIGGEVSPSQRPVSGTVFAGEGSVGAAGNLGSPGEADDQAQQSMFRDIDSILTRLETGITAERMAMDALLARLAGKAA